MSDTVITFKNVSKTYRLYKSSKQRALGIFMKSVPCIKKQAVKKVSFSVRQGEAVALFGKNGAGKSTILKMITGVCFPTEGEITVKGTVSALLELTAGFDKEFTGRENIYLKGRLMGLSDDKISEMEEAVIDFAEIEEYIDQPVRTYSSGMKARLGFAICVSVDPDILIVDEALSVGDKQFRAKCQNKIKELISDNDTTLLFVTHSTSTASSFCQRGIVLKKGELIFDGDIKDAISLYNSGK